MAIATAMVWTGKNKILVFQGGYHGATLSFRIPPVGVTHKSVNLPHEWVIGTYNDFGKMQNILLEVPANNQSSCHRRRTNTWQRRRYSRQPSIFTIPPLLRLLPRCSLNLR